MLHFKPSSGRFGDPIPFFWDGKFHLFHLIAPQEPPPTQGHHWGHAVSIDLLHWEELPVIIPLGGPGDADEHETATGSVIERDGRFYLLYLGRRWNEHGTCFDTICLSQSDDLVQATKHGDNPILAPDTDRYDPFSWRDPCVFWNEEAGRYWMVIAACLKEGPFRHCGCLALATSDDLIHWQTEPEPFWAPNLTARPLECPDVFQWNGWWYLIFYVDGGTRYRMSRQLTGPWLKPANDTFGGYHIAAGKTAFDGERRWLFAFLMANEGDTDKGARVGQDVMALPRELKQNPDGTLRVAGHPDLSSVCGEPVRPTFHPMLGEWKDADGRLTGSRPDGFAYAVADVPTSRCVIEAMIRFGERGGHVGIAVRTEDDLRPGYMLWLVPEAAEARWTILPGWYGLLWWQAQPMVWDTTRSLTVRMVVDETAMEAFINGQTAISGRLYDATEGKLALIVQDGDAVFESITVRPLTD